MPRTIPTALQTHLNNNSHAVVRLVKLTRVDGTVLRFAETDVPVTVDGETFQPGEGLVVGSVPFGLDGFASGIDLSIGATTETLIDVDDLRAGLWDDAEIYVYVADAINPEHGKFILFYGNAADIEIEREGQAKISFTGLLSRANAISLEYYSAMCRAFLGDKRCRIPILPNGGNYKPDIQRSTAYAVGDLARVRTAGANNPSDYANRYFECTTAGTTAGSAPTWNTTIGGTTTDGTVVWTARDAWVRYGQIDTINNGYSFTLKNFTESRAVDGWFKDGLIIFRSGVLAGKMMEVRDWEQTTKTVKTFLALEQTPAADDWVEIYPGCDRTVTMCRDRYENVINMRAEPNVPGKAVVAAYSTNQVTIGYVGFPSIASGTPASGTVTFNAVSIGAAAQDRVVVVVVHANNETTSRSISGVNIAGSAATIHVQSSVAINTCVVGIASRVVTSGTSATVEVTMSGGVDDIAIEVYVLRNVTSTGPYSTDQQTAQDPAYQLDATVDTPANGVVIEGFTGNGASDLTVQIEFLNGGTLNIDTVVGTMRVAANSLGGTAEATGVVRSSRSYKAQLAMAVVTWA